VEGKVNFVALMEVFIDLNEYFPFEQIISRLHFIAHFVVLEVSVGESECALGHWLGVGLVPVIGDKLTVC